MRKLYLQNGMTLLEVLVVIVIISILAAILVPVSMRARDAARATQCSNNLVNLGKTFMLYATDHDEYFCWAADGGSVCEGNLYTYYWYELLTGYTEGMELFDCPSLSSGIKFGCYSNTGTFEKTSDHYGREYAADYTANELLLRGKLASGRYPDSTVLAWDCAEPGMSRGYVLNLKPVNQFPEENGGGPDWGGANGNGQQLPESDPNYGRDSHFQGHWTGAHRGGNNYVFIDGHVAWYAPEIAGRDWHFASRDRHWELNRNDLE